MAVGHSHLLYRHGDSVVHRLPAHAKIVSLVAFVLIVVATPRDRFWAFPAYAALLAVVAVLARVPATFIARRMVVEIPFVVFALLMPVVSTGERSDVLGISLSDDGLLAGWNILAKGTLGVVASILLAATTDARALLVGLQRLRLPNRLVEIAAFMVRYGDVVAGEMQRMRIARESRAFEARHLGHLRVVAQGAGALFVRTYERGERVHLAMLARGYAGAMPLVGATLDVHGLAFAYPDGHQALFGVDLVVGRGERVALLGPNGAGKTTLVLHLNGILTAGVGTVRVAGLEVRPRDRETLREVRRRVGIVFQDPDDQLFMPTVRDDVAFGPANLGLEGRALEARVAAALDAVGMSEVADRPPHHLSFGQRRRVAVATVLAMEPEVLVLDEPTSNLDPASRRELAEVLDSLEVTMLVVTHDLPYALELCERSVVLSGGTVVADGPTADVLGDADLLAEHRLELPYGFDPRSVPGRKAGYRGARPTMPAAGR